MPRPDPETRCLNCDWFERINGSGVCKRYAPTPLNHQRADRWSYPLVLNDGWCGDFSKAKSVIQLVQEILNNETNDTSS